MPGAIPIEPALRLIVDGFEWCAEHAPQWNTISISGYHIREAGSTAAQELAFTLADGFTYVERGIARGLDVDDFAPRLSFFWDIHNDFFEEIAKLRAARRIWARHMQGALRREESALVDDALPFADRRRDADRAAADEQHRARRLPGDWRRCSAARSRCTPTRWTRRSSLPTEEAVQVALRTQQILAYETGVPNVIDPLGGSYYVEALTDQLEREAEELFAQIETVGGVVQGLEKGWFQRKIAESAARQQWEIEQHRKRGRRRQRVRHRRAGAHASRSCAIGEEADRRAARATRQPCARRATTRS